MGLILWYPFTKNTKNYGGTENFSWPPIVSNGGPLGSFASFNHASYITLKIISLPNCSISFYFSLKDNLNSLNNTIFSVTNGGDVIFRITSTEENELANFVNFEKLEIKNNDYVSFLTLTANLNEWYHVVLICQNTILKVYINNKIAAIAKLNTDFGTTFTFGGVRDRSLRFCDIRIYDNCLDENDIARIYRGSTLDIVATERRGGIIYDHSGYLSFFPISSPNMPLIVANNMVFTDNIIELRQAGTKFNVLLSVWFKPDWNYTSPCEALFVNSIGGNDQAVIFSPKSEAISFSSSISPTEDNLIPISSSDDFINIIRNYKSSETFVNGILVKPKNGNLLNKDIINLLAIGGDKNNYYNFVGQIKKITAYNNLATADIPLLYESEKKMLTEIENFYSASTLEYLEFGVEQFVNLSGWGPNLDKVFSIEIDIEFDIDVKALKQECCLITTYTGRLFLWLYEDSVYIFENQIPFRYEDFGEYYRARFNLTFDLDNRHITLQEYDGKDVYVVISDISSSQAEEIFKSLNLNGIVLGNTEPRSFDGKLYYVKIIFYNKSLNEIFHKNFTPKEENNIKGLTDGNTFYPLVSNH